jgi:hypothetical protein
MWTLDNKPFTTKDVPSEAIGFIYCITDTVNQKQYIGKKIFYNTIKRNPLKGKKRKRVSKVDSDWESYFGSNDEFKEIVEKTEDKSVFKREILFLCRNKTEMSYLETREHFLRGVLLSDMYYNGWITCKITKRGLDGLRIHGTLCGKH